MKHNFAFHIYDHDEEETFQIVGKSNFMRWLNDHADQQRYSFFSTYEKLKKYLNHPFQNKYRRIK